MKNLQFTKITLVVLAIVAAFFYFSQRDSTLDATQEEFRVLDTASISGIRIKPPSGKVISLQRQENQWLVNQTFAARQDAINKMLKIFRNLELKVPVSSAEQARVKKHLQDSALQIEIRENGEIQKKLFLGKSNARLAGTYAMLGKGKTAVVLHIPGFQPDLKTYFSLLPKYWRSQKIFHLPPAQIAGIKVEHPQSPEKSFEIVRQQGKFEVKGSNLPRGEVNQENLDYYLSLFQDIAYESIATNVPQARKDSLLASPPQHIISLTKQSGQRIEVSMYSKPLAGKSSEPDLNRFYAIVNQGNELLIAKYVVFDPLLKDSEYFFEK